MAECDISNSDLATAFTSSSLDGENISNTTGDGNKKRKTHRLKQRFQVVKKLGQGTYGKVQLAINNETGQEVAIKTIKKSKVSNQQDLVRIRREIQIMSSINHPNIIHIFEVFENKDKIVLVMQYASGGELYDYVSFHKALSDTEARRVFRQIATAIYYCHKNKICHRDLKLENILLDEKGNAKIADFGLSNVFDDKHFLQTFCGSPLYASPEIVRGLPYFGPEVDCWSLGVLLYTLVYGAMPFDGSNFKKLVKQISEANYFEPPEKSPATELIHKLLTPEPKERASIIDICMDPWVNQDCEHLLLQVAEDMSNLTNHAVRLDMLLALAPGATQQNEQNQKPPPAKPSDSNETTITTTEDVSNKRPNETNSANDSLADMVGKKTTKKKSKKSTSNEQIMSNESTKQETETILDEDKPSEVSESIKEEMMIKKSNDEQAIIKADENREKENQATILPTESEPTKIVENETNKNNNSQTSLKSNESSGSITTKKRGRISIPKIWDDNQEKLKGSSSSNLSPRKEPISPGLFSVSELKKELEQRTKADTSGSSSGALAKRRDTLADTSELKQSATKIATENAKKYKNRSISLNLKNIVEKNTTTTIDDKLKSNQKEELLKSTNESRNETTTDSQFGDDEKMTTTTTTTTATSKTSSTSSIKDDKSLAKQIIQKNIAKAKLMEKRQTSVQSTTATSGLQSGETTPLISIENSTISVMKNSPNSSATNIFFRKSGIHDPVINNSNDKNDGSLSSSSSITDNNQNLSSVTNPAPISRSYKKVIFTKDGAKITETGKFYSHEGDGVTTRVEKTSRITITNNNNNNNSSSSTLLQRSDSQSSTGSLDIFDDIFDDHWTDNLFSNAKSLFYDFFGRRGEKLSLRSRAESLERTNFFPGRSTDSMKSERKFPLRDHLFERQGNSSFGSHKSLFTTKSIFSNSSFSKSSMMQNDFNMVDDMMGGDRRTSRIDDLKQKYGLSRFSSADQTQKDFFGRNRTMFDDSNDLMDQSTRKSRIEQWLNHHDEIDNNNEKDFDNCMNTYGTMMRPRRYSRTMTAAAPNNINTSTIIDNSNVKTDIIKRVEVTNSSATCQVIRHKKSSAIKSDNIAPRDIQLNFKLDDSTGALILNQSNIIPTNIVNANDVKNSSQSANDLKIEEPSSLLEQLRTFGYKKLVDRRLSDSSSTEDLPTAETVVKSSSSMVSSSNKSSERNVIDDDDDENCSKNDIETKAAKDNFHYRMMTNNDQSTVNNLSSSSLSSKSLLFPTSSSSSSSSKMNSSSIKPSLCNSISTNNCETVEERIHRKSYYSRFNNDDQKFSRQRRRSVSRLMTTTSFDYQPLSYPFDTNGLTTPTRRLYSQNSFSNSNNSFVRQQYDRSNSIGNNNNNNNNDSNRIYQRFNSFELNRRSSSVLRDLSQTRTINRSRFLNSNDSFNVNDDNNNNNNENRSSTTSNIIDRIRASKLLLRSKQNSNDQNDDNITVTNGGQNN
ncbi:uncharacterized protein LOC124491459 isoform X2 [Dermatophagoides farinae]|uniref:uncharacterized protein LOC124491459 isoform X2 n=1 Tax=Dermatophagoides farinae TaxID=6954 RepID=UPI003F5D5647